MPALVIAAAAGVAVGLCILWDRVLDRIVAGQMRREADRLRSQRHEEPQVLGGAPRQMRCGSRP